MENISAVKQSINEQSINISKPIGISSFWNLISKNNNKQNLQNVSNSDTSKVNIAIMKLLKSKGIDLKSLENFDVNGNKTLKQNKIFIINPNQENLTKEDLTRKNILFKSLRNKNNVKTVDGFKATFTPPSNVSVKSDKGVVSFSMTFLKSKRTKDIDVKEKKGITLNEKENERLNILSSTIGQNQKVLFKAIPKEKLKKSKRKRVMVPVYIGNKKSSKSSNSKKEKLSDANGQDDSFNGPSLVSKTKTVMEEQINRLKCKSSKTKQTSCKTFLEINSLTPSSNRQSKDFVIKACTSMGRPNKAEGNKSFSSTKLQTSKQGKENSLSKEDVDKDNGNKPKLLSKECSDHNATNLGNVSKQSIGNFNDILYNPDVLIKNHNLIIPRDISQDSLFQANPYAGCDTILKLFKALSQVNDRNNNQPINILPKKNKGHKEERKTRECPLENTNKVETVLTRESETSNISSAIPNTFSNRNIGSDCSIKYKNGLRNIFSLPMNFNILKSLERSKSDEKKVSFEGTNSESDKITKSSNDIEVSSCFQNTTVITNCYKEENSCHLEDANCQNKNTTEKISENLEKESKSKEIFKEASIIMISNDLKSCESDLNNVDIIKKKTSLSHPLQNPSSASKENLTDESSYKISVGASERNKSSFDRLELNISHEEFGMSGTVKQSQKLFKKTTISCPLETPEQKVSITILIENDVQDRKILLSNRNVETASSTQFREIKHKESSVDLKQIISEKEEHLSKINPQLPDDVSSAFCNLMHSTPKFFSEIRTEYVDDANEQSIYNKKEVKAKSFGLTSNKQYLKQKERKIFDEEVLGVDHYEKSIDLSNLKFRKRKEEMLSDINYRPGLINILSESSVGSEKAYSCNRSKVNTLSSRKILHRFGKCFTRNPFYTETVSKVKNQSRTKITQRDKYFRSYKEQINIPERCFSINQIDIPFVPNNANQFFVTTSNQQFLKPEVRSQLVSTECDEGLKHVDDVEGKSCRFSFILNQQPYVTQAENSFLFPKTSPCDQVEQVQGVDIEQNYNSNDSDWLNSMTDIMRLNNGFEMFRVCDTNCSPKNNQSKALVQTNFNTVKNSQISFLSNNCKLNTTDKTNSTVAVRSLENNLSVANDRKISNFEKPLSNFQYKKVGNRIHSICFSNNTNKSIQDESENFQDKKRINSEILLCTHAFKIPENFKENPNFGILVKSEPQLLSFTTIKALSAQNILNGTNREISKIEKIDNQINLNIKNTCNCCKTGCLTVMSEEGLIDFCENM